VLAAHGPDGVPQVEVQRLEVVPGAQVGGLSRILLN